MSAEPEPSGEAVLSHSPEETHTLGATVGKALRPGDLVALNGDLGAGKTIFAQGLGEGLGVSADQPVRSPTFAIFDMHQGRVPVVHVDLYRIEQPEEIEALGILDLLDRSVVIVEWFERSGGMLGAPNFTVTLAHKAGDPNLRNIEISRPTDR